MDYGGCVSCTLFKKRRYQKGIAVFSFCHCKNIEDNHRENIQKSARFFGSLAIVTVLVIEGETSPAFAEAKGGEYVKPNQRELDTQSEFDSFSKKVLRNEARDHYDKTRRLRSKEISISELTMWELERLSTTDGYFMREQTFNVLGYDVVVSDENIAEALRSLQELKREIILLYYFLWYSDMQIGERLSMKRSTVQYQRTTALHELKRIMEEKDR